MSVSVVFDGRNFNKILKNSVIYSQGFLSGIEKNRLVFNKKLSDIVAESLKKYIDTKARMSPESLHHVYEWNRVGNPSARLFEIDCVPTPTTITIVGRFLPSSSISENSSEPFIDKANVMENKIEIEIEPKFQDVLAFDINGESVFTVNSVFIANPGGDEVAGSFGRAVEDFFNFYFNTTILKQSGILSGMEYPQEFAQYFNMGVRGAASSTGEGAGKKYMNIEGVSVL